MTRDESRNPKDAESQRIVDALSDLFDTNAPNDRVSAEAELHDAGLDPATVARRSEQIAARVLSVPMVGSSTGTAHRAAGRRAGGPRSRPAAPPPAIELAPRRGGRQWLPRMAAVLVIGIGIGWLLGSQFMEPASRSADIAAGERGDGLARHPPTDGDRPGSIFSRRQDADSLGAAVGAPTPPSESVSPAAAAAPTAVAPPPDDTPISADLARDSAVAQGAVIPTERFVLDSNNWQNGEGLLPPAVLDRVKRGDYWFTVQSIDPERFEDNYSWRFWQASDLNAGRYRVAPDTCALIERDTSRTPEAYFGYPFPTIDPADPLAGCMIAWNIEAAGAMGEGQGATFTTHSIDRTGELRRLRLSLRAMSYVGRHAAAPSNPRGLRSASLLTLLEASDVDPLAVLTLHSHEATTPDTVWQYIPQLRRVRRVDAANRSDFFLGLDVLGDDLNCFDGKIEDFTWKVLGEQQVLAPITSPLALAQQPTTPTRSEVNVPYAHAAYETPGAPGVPWLMVDNLLMVPRPVWVIEVQPRSPYYYFGRLLLWVDREMYRTYWKAGHQRDGSYLYSAMCPYHWSKSANGEFSAVTPSFVVGVNEQIDRATIAGRHPSQFIEREFAEDFFTVKTMTERRE